MKRRQAKRCVIKNLREHRPMHSWRTWQRVLRTLARHRLVFLGQGKGHSWANEPEEG